jgi:hypothetical protein
VTQPAHPRTPGSLLPRRVSGRRYIYELVDPRTGETRYVGLTADPAERLWNHRSPTGHTSKALREWREDLARAGHTIQMRILAGPIADTVAKRCERRWIEDRVAGRHALLNAKPGGSLGAMKVVWSRALCERRITAFINEAGLVRYPTPRELTANGLSTAYNVLRRCDGHVALAKRLGLTRTLRDWSEVDDLEAAVLELASRLGPTLIRARTTSTRMGSEVRTRRSPGVKGATRRSPSKSACAGPSTAGGRRSSSTRSSI